MRIVDYPTTRHRWLNYCKLYFFSLFINKSMYCSPFAHFPFNKLPLTVAQEISCAFLQMHNAQENILCYKFSCNDHEKHEGHENDLSQIFVSFVLFVVKTLYLLAHDQRQE